MPFIFCSSAISPSRVRTKKLGVDDYQTIPSACSGAGLDTFQQPLDLLSPSVAYLPREL